MEPHGSSGTRVEAERWLLIAEKLLAGRDLVGSKTFAIRSRDSEPQLEAAEQILAVADTLIAGEKRIDGGGRDWYAVLQLPHLAADPDLVADHYRRLAVLLNPHRNRLAFADHAMKLVSDAWSVLSNPSKKSLYDNELVLSNIVEEPQEQEQPQNAPTKTPRNFSNHNNKSKNVEEENEIPNNHEANSTNNHDVNSTFWTACPYCYNMYEYAGIYVDCSLRCQNCQRAFHGTKILEPPPIVEGKEMYFCCWGFYPLGVSLSKSDKNKVGVSSWSPFSPMFSGPQLGERRNGVEDNVNVAGQMNVNNAGKNSEPRIYIDDQDVYVEISESDGESDDDWGSTRQKKKTKTAKEKRSTGKNVKKPTAEKAKNVKVGSGNDLQGGYVLQEFMGAPNVLNAEASRKAAAYNPKKFPKQWGRLDLNVEFNNEGEESAPGMSRVNAPGLSIGIAPGMNRGITPGMNKGNGAGNGEEDGIEGNGFFEGLDEFLSSLPILKS